jgi:membrane-bound serine protease (ClpP class)
MLRSLAQLRGRNVEWAEKAVRDAATLTAEDALKEGVIDVVARDLDDLLAQIEGRKVTINAVEHTIATKGVRESCSSRIGAHDSWASFPILTSRSSCC